jgi:hypothetical protein
VDETLERRRGTKIAARGVYRDPVRSSHGHFVKASGLRWVCLMLLVPVPWASRAWALPFLSTLAPSERYAEERAGRAPQEDNRLGAADAALGQALVARARDRGRGRFGLRLHKAPCELPALLAQAGQLRYPFAPGRGALRAGPAA